MYVLKVFLRSKKIYMECDFNGARAEIFLN